MEDKYQSLRAGTWSGKYLCKLALLDHLRECLEKDNYLKATDTPKSNDLYKQLDKELMDLKIILRLYFEENSELELTRLDKFLANQ